MARKICAKCQRDMDDTNFYTYKNGEIEKKDTFSKRELTEMPKFVQKKIKENKNAEE